MTARSVAVDALVRVEEGAYSNLVLPGLLRSSGLSARDRAFVTDLVYGTLRRQGAIDHLLTLVADRPLTRLDPPVRAALRLGTHQLLTGTPPHAAVGETVGALTGPAGRAKAYVNAVLRKVAALGPAWPWPDGDDDDALAVRLSHPAWIVALLRAGFGPAATLESLEAANTAPPVTLRPNPLRTTPAALAAELTCFPSVPPAARADPQSAALAEPTGLLMAPLAGPADALSAARPPPDPPAPVADSAAPEIAARASGAGVEPGTLVPGALLVRGIGDPAVLPAVAEGRATPQDQASQAVVAAVAAQPGEAILDLAAAPGGKATGLAEAMGDEGLVIALDVRPGRVALIQRAAGRLGLRSVQSMVADSRRPPVPPDRFDRVLLDAPCSGLGVLRRRPEARWTIQPDDVDRLAALQRELLTAAMAAVRPGGTVTYSVCTFSDAETLGVDEWAAAQWPDWIPVAPLPSPWRPHGRGALILPGDANTDGMFVLQLRRPETLGG